MRELLEELCKLHDTIKNSSLRLSVLNNEVLYESAKQEYYVLLEKFVTETMNYIEKFKVEQHVKLGMRFGIVRGYIPVVIKRDLEKCFNQDNSFMDFVAETDFKVLSKLHVLIEYMYNLLTKNWWTSEFKNRIL